MYFLKEKNNGQIRKILNILYEVIYDLALWYIFNKPLIKPITVYVIRGVFCSLSGR